MANRKNLHSQYASFFPKAFLAVSLYLSLTLVSYQLSAQSYQEAKDLAYNGQREKAKEMCKKMIAVEFDSDVAVLLGRIYAWEGKYDSTRVWESEVLKRYPTHWDALDAMSDVQYWDEKYQDAIKYCDLALEKDSKDEHFMFKKANILNAMKDYNESVKLLENLLKSYPSNAEARNKLESIRLDQLKNVVRVSYTYDYFDQNPTRDPWHMASLSYGRKTPIGKVVARVNWAERFGTRGYQYEVDAYPKISKNNYAYMNFGLSNVSFFPTVRAGAEWYHSFPRAIEGSLGMRALYFTSSDVYMITGTLGKYVGNYWLSFRTYVIPSSDGTSVSGSFQVRRYFSDPENYIGLRVGSGISPDNRSFADGTSSVTLLNSQSVRAEYNHIFNRIWTTNIGVSLSHDDTRNFGYVMDYSFDVGIGRYF